MHVERLHATSDDNELHVDIIQACHPNDKIALRAMGSCKGSYRILNISLQNKVFSWGNSYQGRYGFIDASPALLRKVLHLKKFSALIRCKIKCQTE